jgi:hypothetical protein
VNFYLINFNSILSFSYGIIEIGSNVLVKIPDVDKPKIGPRNVLAVVLEINKAEFYRFII